MTIPSRTCEGSVTAAAIAGFDGGFGFDPEAGANEGIEYLVRNGDTVELKWERSGDTFRKRYKRKIGRASCRERVL